MCLRKKIKSLKKEQTKHLRLFLKSEYISTEIKDEINKIIMDNV